MTIVTSKPVSANMKTGPREGLRFRAEIPDRMRFICLANEYFGEAAMRGAVRRHTGLGHRAPSDGLSTKQAVPSRHLPAIERDFDVSESSSTFQWTEHHMQDLSAAPGILIFLAAVARSGAAGKGLPIDGSLAERKPAGNCSGSLNCFQGRADFNVPFAQGWPFVQSLSNQHPDNSQSTVMWTAGDSAPFRGFQIV